MIHAGGDNYSDHPEALGGGGARVACGVDKVKFHCVVSKLPLCHFEPFGLLSGKLREKSRATVTKDFSVAALRRNDMRGDSFEMACIPQIHCLP